MLTTMIKAWHSEKSINLPKMNTMIRVHLQAISHNMRRNYVIIMQSQHKHQTNNNKKDIKPTRSFVALHRSKDEDDSFVVCRCIHGINLVFDDIGLKKTFKHSTYVLCHVRSHARPELITTFIRMSSIKSQSLTVPSVEQEYACNKWEHSGIIFLIVSLEWNKT